MLRNSVHRTVAKSDWKMSAMQIHTAGGRALPNPLGKFTALPDPQLNFGGEVEAGGVKETGEWRGW